LLYAPKYSTLQTHNSANGPIPGSAVGFDYFLFYYKWALQFFGYRQILKAKFKKTKKFVPDMDMHRECIQMQNNIPSHEQRNKKQGGVINSPI
jgi:hypothetical protein